MKGTDAKFNREIKLEILVRLATPDSVEEILRELQTYCRGAEKDFVCDAATGAARVADADRNVRTTSFAGCWIWREVMIATSVGPWTRRSFLRLWLLLDNYCSRGWYSERGSGHCTT